MVFVGLLNVNDVIIRIRIRIHSSEARIRGSESVPKCHGSATLVSGLLNIYPSTFEERMRGQRRGGVEKSVCSVSQDSSAEQVPGPSSLHHTVVSKY
jgi:hypothetical protein